MRCAVLVFVLFVAVQCAERTVDNTCPTTLLQKEDRFYLQVNGDFCYRFVTHTEKLYNDANNYCKEDGGVLAMPKSQEANDYLKNTLNNTYNTKKSAWIGLHDKKDDSVFKWEDGSAMEWENFDVDNGPYNDDFWGLIAAVEDCVAIHDNGKWHDYICDENFVSFAFGVQNNMPFICQYSVPRATPSTGDVGDDSDEGNTGGDPGQTECPPFFCSKDCGMDGYQTDSNDCQICECSS